jgi:hypothetical protein
MAAVYARSLNLSVTISVKRRQECGMIVLDILVERFPHYFAYGT